MKNKINYGLVGLLSFFLSFENTFADQQVVETNYFNSFYLGAGLGVLSTRATYSTSSSATFVGNFLNNTTINTERDSSGISDTSFAGILLVGTRNILNSSKWYTNLEVFSTIANRNMNASSGTGPITYSDLNFPNTIVVDLNDNIKTKQNVFDIGLDFRLGGYLNPRTIFYFKTGPVFNRLKITQSSTFSNTDDGFVPSVTTTSGISTTITKTLSGILLGLGSEIAYTKNIHFSLDAQYVLFSPNVKIGLSGDTISPRNPLGERNVVVTNGLNNNSKIENINNVSVFLGIKYYL